MEVITDHKTKADELYKENEFKSALDLYKKALKLSEEYKEMKKIILSNISACHLKLKNWLKVVKYTTIILNTDCLNIKALYKRSIAYEQLGEYINSFSDLKALVNINGENIYEDRYNQLFKLAYKEYRVKSDPNDIFQKLLSKLMIVDNKEEIEKKLIQISCDINVHKNLVNEENIKLLIDILDKKCYQQIIFNILTQFVKKSYKITHFILNYMQIDLSLYFNQNQIITYTVIEFIANCIESLLIEFYETNIEPSKDEVFCIRNEYFNKFFNFLQNNIFINTNIKFICNHLIPYTFDNYHIIIKNLRSLYKIINLHRYISYYILHTLLIPKLISNSTPNIINNDFWNNYQDYKYFISLLTGFLSTIYESIQIDQKYSKLFYDTIDEILLKQLASKDIYKFVLTIYPLIDINIDVLNYILCDSTNLYGSKILDIFSININEFHNQMLNSNPNMLIFICEFLNEFQISNKFKSLKQYHQPFYNIFQYCFNHTNIHIKSVALLSLVKNIDNETDEILNEYYNYTKIIFQQKDQLFHILALEILSFLSLYAYIKEILINDNTIMDIIFQFTSNICQRINNSKNDYNDIDHFKLIPSLFNVLSLFSNLINIKQPGDCNTFQPAVENKKELKKLAQTIGQPLPKKHPKDKKNYIQNRILLLSKPRFFSLLSNIVSSLKVCQSHPFINRHLISNQLPYLISSLYYTALKDEQFRSIAVQCGAVKSLLTLCQSLKIGIYVSQNDKIQSHSPYIAANALALIIITIHPTLCFNDDTVIDSIIPLLCCCDFDQPPLRKYECLLALTNIASIDDKIRDYFSTLSGFMRIIESNLFDQDHLIKQATLEFINNLVLNPNIIETHFCLPQFISQSDIPVENRDRRVERLRILVLLAGETETPSISYAALGVLCLLSLHSTACQFIFDLNVFYQIIQEILQSSDSESTIYRCLFILKNSLLHQPNHSQFVLDHFKDNLINFKQTIKSTHMAYNTFEEIIKLLNLN